MYRLFSFSPRSASSPAAAPEVSLPATPFCPRGCEDDGGGLRMDAVVLLRRTGLLAISSGPAIGALDCATFAVAMAAAAAAAAAAVE